ncbi:tetratricopeptide repeat protein [Neosynechococcus sphagnicola]|uniref:tetratricopeptide repeat protein n=1 Tax=Neosynechococcus sphagnicola TaxID=1501145 RepID=UPI00068EC572|nr:tetratricopeptide repeat protein [Neosynechococcus sphagnicola]
MEAGNAAFTAGQLSLAITIWQQALQQYQQQDDLLNQAMVLGNLALAYQELGQFAAANQAIVRSLKLLPAQVQGSQPTVALVLARVWNTQGSLQFRQGHYEAALTTWQQATAAYTQAQDTVGMIRSRLNQAQALRALGLYHQAMTLLQQLNQTLQQQPQSLITAVALRSLGDTLGVIGDPHLAQQTLERSLAIARRLENSPAIAAALLSLGNTARAQANVSSALALYQQAATTDPPLVPVTSSGTTQFPEFKRRSRAMGHC